MKLVNLFNFEIYFLFVSLVALTLFLMPDLAVAQGFASEAESMLENIALGIHIIVGVVATIALLWTFAEGFMGRKTWADVFTQAAWIIGAGAAISLATWIFTSGQGISFN
ncbi:hypothetical protein OURE66S_01256 [Oligella ureolytica]